MTYSYHPHARKEFDDATDYYDAIDPELGDDFLEEIDELHYSHSQISTSMDKAGRISQAMPNASLSLQSDL